MKKPFCIDDTLSALREISKEYLTKQLELIKEMPNPLLSKINVISDNKIPEDEAVLTDRKNSVLIDNLNQAEFRIGVYKDHIKKLEHTIEQAAALLDDIKYDLNASVYTLEDDEFATVFYVRDLLQAMLPKKETK